MIDANVFRTSRELARSKLPADQASNSFGYYIDIPNVWETYRKPDDLVRFLGIHSTHADRYNEIINDLGSLTKAEYDWAARYVFLCDRVASLLTTTGLRTDLKHDLAETLFDWRTIMKFVGFPCRVLDFGAGCGRQGASALLRHSGNIYTAIDSVLAAYTIQNLMFSSLATLMPETTFHDFLDFEAAGLPLPDIAQAKQGSLYHLPAWLAEANVPERYFDVILACHVHGELSEHDFRRLISIVDKGLAQDGVFYVRSELTWGDTRDFFDSVDLHGLDMVEILRGKDVVPVYCRNESAYLTTLFARRNSAWHKKALESKEPEFSFIDMARAGEVSAKAGEHFVQRQAESMAKDCQRILWIGTGDLFSYDIVKSALKKARRKKAYSEEEILGSDQEALARELASFDPDAVVICSHSPDLIEAALGRLLPNHQFPLRRHYWFPVIFLFKDLVGRPDPIFQSPILGPQDLPEEIFRGAMEQFGPEPGNQKQGAPR